MRIKLGVAATVAVCILISAESVVAAGPLPI